MIFYFIRGERIEPAENLFPWEYNIGTLCIRARASFTTRNISRYATTAGIRLSCRIQDPKVTILKYRGGSWEDRDGEGGADTRNAFKNDQAFVPRDDINDTTKSSRKRPPSERFPMLLYHTHTRARALRIFILTIRIYQSFHDYNKFTIYDLSIEFYRNINQLNFIEILITYPEIRRWAGVQSAYKSWPSKFLSLTGNPLQFCAPWRSAFILLSGPPPSNHRYQILLHTYVYIHIYISI